MNQCQEILAAMKAGKAVTQAWATKHRVHSLSRRICDLKAAGHSIGKRMVPRKSKRSGKILRFAAYYLRTDDEAGNNHRA